MGTPSVESDHLSRSEMGASPAFLTPRLLLLHRTKPRVFNRPHCSLTITSPQNPRIKATRQLQRRRTREKERQILLEGPRLINDALQSNTQPIEIFHTPQSAHASLATAKSAGARLTPVTEAVLRTLCDTVTPQGILGVFETPSPVLPASPSLALVCDNVRDPGNLGTLVRSAAAAGVDAVLLTQGCADVWALKTLRAGMGAQFRIPVLSGLSWAQIGDYCQGMHMFIADGSGECRHCEVDWTNRCALVVGSEADGPSKQAFEHGRGVSIGMSNSVESLNAAMAGTVILFEAARQRSLVSAEL